VDLGFYIGGSLPPPCRAVGYKPVNCETENIFL